MFQYDYLSMFMSWMTLDKTPCSTAGNFLASEQTPFFH